MKHCGIEITISSYCVGWLETVYNGWKLYVSDLIHALHLQLKKWTLTNGMATYNLYL